MSLPGCAGVRGELDKIVERSATHGDTFDPACDNPRLNDLRLGRDREDDDDDRRPKRRESWLSELFDFD